MKHNIHIICSGITYSACYICYLLFLLFTVFPFVKWRWHKKAVISVILLNTQIQPNQTQVNNHSTNLHLINLITAPKAPSTLSGLTFLDSLLNTLFSLLNTLYLVAYGITIFGPIYTKCHCIRCSHVSWWYIFNHVTNSTFYSTFNPEDDTCGFTCLNKNKIVHFRKHLFVYTFSSLKIFVSQLFQTDMYKTHTYIYTRN